MKIALVYFLAGYFLVVQQVKVAAVGTEMLIVALEFMCEISGEEVGVQVCIFTQLQI